MKRLICLVLCFGFLMSGCSLFEERIKEPVKFYYLRTEFDYRNENGVIAYEEREASGHRNNLSYLLALYRMGPSNEDLRLPFPEGTAILMMDESDQEIKLALGNTADSMSDAEFSLACACLTLTCTELVNVQQVTIVNGERLITMTRDSITLMDTVMAQVPEETQ